MQGTFSAVFIVSLFAAAATTATPTTPTFVLKWGNLGSAPGQFFSPDGVATDAAGNIYVADQVNHRVQKFNRLGNFLTQWGGMGSGDGSFNRPTAVAVDATGNVYVADLLNHRIQKFTGTGTFVSKWGSMGSGNGQFNSPFGVATDAAGNVYVVDSANHRIQKFSSTGTFLTKWGTLGSGDGQFNVTGGVAVDAAGSVYVTDVVNRRIQKFTNTGTFVAKWGSPGSGDGQFNTPSHVATDAAGNVYVADSDNNRVQKFSGNGTFLGKWGSLGTGDGQFNNPFGVATDAAGNVYVSEVNNNRIQKFSSAGAALSEPPAAVLLEWGSFGTGNGQFDQPRDVATDAVGNVYVADHLNHRIQKFTSTGTYLTQWGGVNSPGGVDVNPNGFVYVADSGNNRVRVFTRDGISQLQWGSFGTGNGQFDNPFRVASDAAGNVYVLDRFNHRIQKFTSTGTYLTQWGSMGSGNGQFDLPFGLAVDAAANVYVVDQLNDRVQKFSSTGTYLTQWGSLGSGNGQFLNPVGVDTDAAGNVYVADGDNSRIQKFTSNGTYLTQWAGGVFPQGVATDAAGNVYVSEISLFGGGIDRITKFATPPAIALVSDVGNDQGRQVRLRVLRSSADAPGATAQPILRYDVFRRSDPPPGSVLLDESSSAESRNRVMGASESPQLAGWEQVGSFSARGESEYNFVAPTLVDANAEALRYSAFVVSAATADPFTFYDSGTEFGFSVDNLSPPPPTPFTAAYLAGATHLHWGVSPARDFATFRLYRGSAADFVPGPGNLVAATTDTGYTDVGPGGSHYKLSAVDLNGNESPFAALGPNQTVDASGPAPALSFGLEALSPNPMRGRELGVRFTLPVALPARLELLDVAGRQVEAREVGGLGIGRHAVNLAEGRRLPPGMYLVRLTQGANLQVRRAIVLE